MCAREHETAAGTREPRNNEKKNYTVSFFKSYSTRNEIFQKGCQCIPSQPRAAGYLGNNVKRTALETEKNVLSESKTRYPKDFSIFASHRNLRAKFGFELKRHKL